MNKFDIQKFVETNNTRVAAEFNIAKKITELTGALVNIEISTNRKGRLTFTSGSIEQTPKMFEDLKIESFNSDVMDDNGEAIWWFTCHYSYQHFNGGSNGSSIFTGWMTEAGELKATRDWS